MALILYRAASNRQDDTRTLYVREMPGHGGADWGYVDDPAQAARVSPHWARRFAADMEHVGARWFGSQPVPA